MNYLDERDYLPARAPNPGLAAVLSVLLPGLGHLYTGRFLAGGAWFVAVGFGYWAILVPGLLLHIICVWTSYQSARFWRGF